MAWSLSMTNSNAQPTPSRASKKPSLPVSLGARIKELRKARGWSQRDLCARANVSPAQLSKYESGTNQVPLRALIRIARALAVPLDTLLPDTGSDVTCDAEDAQLLARFLNVLALGREEKAVACSLLDTVIAMQSLREARKPR